MLGPFGVPQGSVLGSLLFIISQNDLPAAHPTPRRTLSTPQPQDTGQTVVYVDDDTVQESAKTPHLLMSRLQARVDSTVAWLSDNRMVISPGKTKLLVTALPDLRRKRCRDFVFSVAVGGHTVHASRSEKLLGIVLSEDLTWSPHLWGESWRTEKNWPGVISQLTQRLGLLKHLAKSSSPGKLKGFVHGLFMSKLLYGLPLFSSLWAIAGYADQEPRKHAFRLHDLLKLQTLQNRAARLLQPLVLDSTPTPTATLLANVGWLSVHQ